MDNVGLARAGDFLINFFNSKQRYPANNPISNAPKNP